MKSKFKELRFKTEGEFRLWLAEHTWKIIDFQSNGQDLTKIWIDRRGEIINCDMQGGVWSGVFVNIGKLKVGSFIEMHINRWKTMDFLIESIQ